jgi:hypothetical protein
MNYSNIIDQESKKLIKTGEQLLIAGQFTNVVNVSYFKNKISL